MAMARQSMALLMSAKKAGATPKTPQKKNHHHEHHEPHLPEGVNAGDWDKWVHMFEEPGVCHPVCVCSVALLLSCSCSLLSATRTG
jgi:hypothetical protein